MNRLLPRLLVTGAAVVLIAATALVVALADRYISSRMQELKTGTIAMAEGLLGRTIRYQSISPSILQYVEIHDLAILDAEGGDPLLTLHTVKVSYSLLGLLARRDPLGALREIRIENTHLEFDTARDRDLMSLFERLLEPSGGGGESRFRARLVGANVSLDVTAGDSKISLTGLFFSADTRTDSLEVSLRGGVNGSLGSGFSFRSAAKVQGKVGRLLDWSDLTVRLLSFSSSVVSTGAQSLQVIWKGKSLEIRKIQDRSPVDLQLDADFAQRSLTLRFLSDQFRPDRLFRFSGKLQGLNRWVAAPLTASGSVTYGLDKGNLEYSADLSAFWADQLPLPDVDVAARFTGTEKMITFETLRAVSAAGSLDFSGDILFSTLYPQGVLTLSNVEVARGERVSARLAIVRGQGSLRVKADKMQVGDLGLEKLDLSVIPQSGGSRFRLATSFSGGPHGHTLSAEGNLSLGKAPLLTVSASLENVPPDRLYRLVTGTADSQGRKDVADFLSQFALSANLSLTTDFSTVTVRSLPVVLTRWDDPDTRLSCGLTLERGSLRISGFTGSWRGLAVTGELAASMAPDERLAFSSSFSLGGTPYRLSGSYSQSLGLVVSGSYGLDVGVSFAGDGGFSFQARATRMPVPFGIRLEPVSFDMDGSFPSSGDWLLRFVSLSVYDLPLLESKTNTTEIAATLTPEAVDIARVRFRDAVSTLEGRGRVEYKLAGDVFDASVLDSVEGRISLDLKARGSGESYRVSGGIKDGSVSLRAELFGVPLARVGRFAVTGELAGSVSVDGPASHPTMDAALFLQNGRLGTDPLALSGRFALIGPRLELKALSAAYLAHAVSDAAGTFQMDAGTYSFAGHYRGEFFGDAVDADARLEGSLSRTGPGDPLAALLDSGLAGKLSLSSIRVNAKSFDPWGISLHTEGGILYFNGGPKDSIQGSLDSRSRFALVLQQPLPIVGKARGRIVGDRVDATVTVDALDVRILNPILKSPVITVDSGIASGTLAITGPLNDPDYLGQLDLVGGGLTCAYSPEEAGPISTTFVFNRKTFSFAPVNTGAGGARISGSGTFTVDHWSPSSFALDLRTDAATAVHLTGKFGSVRVDGYAVGSLHVSGDDKKTEVKGSLTASDCRIAVGEPVKGDFVPEDPPTYLSLNVQTGKKVEFFWPSVEFPVVRMTGKTGGKVGITYRGDTGAYTVKGAADVQGGEVFYFDRSFVLKSGRVLLDESQADFDPRITVRAEVREWDPKTNEEVKIYLDADNKLSRFSPRFSSDPARPDVDIMAMIGAPILTRAEAQGPMMSAVLLSSDVLSQFGIVRPFEQKVRELLGLDMFSFRTQLIQNLIAQKLFGTAINPLDNTSLSLGKYLGNDLFLEMLVRLQSLPGSPGTASFAAGVQPDVEVNIEWTTPFFLLNWSFLPKTPETLFLSDNAVSLSWRIPF